MSSFVAVYKTDTPILADADPSPRQIGKDQVYSPAGEELAGYIKLTLDAGDVGTVIYRPGDAKAKSTLRVLGAVYVTSDNLAGPISLSVQIEADTYLAGGTPESYDLLATAAHAGGTPYSKAFLWDPTAAPVFFVADEVRVIVTNTSLLAATFFVNLEILEASQLRKL